jgi:hypothetical protein
MNHIVDQLPFTPSPSAETIAEIKRQLASQKPTAVEKDPNGIDAHSPGAKLDAGKPMVSLVLGGFARALMEVAKVGTFGAKKYTPNGWMSVPNGIERYSDARSRHMLYEAMGETHDPDSNLLHAAHEAWNALARLELMLREKGASNG